TADAKEAMISGSEAGLTFATFRTTTRESDDDRTPLNSRTPPNDIGTAVSAPDAYPTPAMNSGPYSTPRDKFGNPLPCAYPTRPTPDPRLRNQYSDGSMGARGAPPPGFVPRGRGYPPRGAYRGGPRGRGGPMPMRGGTPVMMGRGRAP